MRIKIIRFLFLLLIIISYAGFCNFIVKDESVVSSLDDRKVKLSNNNVLSSNENIKKSNDYLAILSIPKINVHNYLYDINSKNNTVDKNVEVIKPSDMPDKENGNLILAAHSGESSIAYFHNLSKLDIGDDVIVSYKDIDYRYKIFKYYDVEKTGEVAIERDKNKKTITLITCKGEDKQLVVIGYSV